MQIIVFFQILFLKQFRNEILFTIGIHAKQLVAQNQNKFTYLFLEIVKSTKQNYCIMFSQKKNTTAQIQDQVGT